MILIFLFPRWDMLIPWRVYIVCFILEVKRYENKCGFFWDPQNRDWDPECTGYRARMDQDEAITAVNVCRAVGLFHMHGPQAMVFNWAVGGGVGDGLGVYYFVKIAAIFTLH